MLNKNDVVASLRWEGAVRGGDERVPLEGDGEKEIIMIILL